MQPPHTPMANGAMMLPSKAQRHTAPEAYHGVQGAALAREVGAQQRGAHKLAAQPQPSHLARLQPAPSTEGGTNATGSGKVRPPVTCRFGPTLLWHTSSLLVR